MSIAAHSAPDGAAPAARCPNCEAPLGGAFCANCGQEAHLHAASTREFLHEFIGHYVAVEGKLWGTLSRLLFRPGALTNEYIRGRRVRFVQPLRIYLTLSLLFFALMKFTGGFDPVMEEEGKKVDDRPVAGAPHVQRGGAAAVASRADANPGKAAAEAAIADMQKDFKVGESADDVSGAALDSDDVKDFKDIDSMLSGWPRVRRQWHAFEALTLPQQKKVFADGFYHYAPYAIFCLMPVFALFLKVLYLGSGRRFGEHVLFALHSNAFAYFVFCLILLVNVAIVDFALWCWLLLYLPWAMRRVYHRSRFGTFWRWLVLMGAYMICVFLAIATSVVTGVMTLH